ncbi:MAG: hypothetical protein IPK42_11380 [Betaproteobacteria bacterium]|nr:hypothetical protein [Betaproteobacteria bacterium]
MAADGSTQAVSVHGLRPGDQVRVPGARPSGLRCVLQGGTTRADESLLSGESQAVAKKKKKKKKKKRR